MSIRLALIPARKNSKRLPKKNQLLLAGKPLIAWSIEAAKKSSFVDKVVVSTDCQEIAEIACKYGAEVPFLRPEELATDEAKSQSLIQHMVQGLEERGFAISQLLLLQPTSPLRTAKHIDEAWSLFLDKQAKAIISVTPCEHHPMWANILPENKNLNAFIKRKDNLRTQDLLQYYRLNGAIYLFARSAIDDLDNVYTEDSYAYIMDNASSIDIDTQFDFDLAEFLLSYKKQSQLTSLT